MEVNGKTPVLVYDEWVGILNKYFYVYLMQHYFMLFWRGGNWRLSFMA